ncbi:hypothetical protein AC249_AIPGENE6656 [Exaiptasia diaphana]|nr:hypothetical protein AC249_AIPGENE6656 [Exaiptasia diaphana]
MDQSKDLLMVVLVGCLLLSLAWVGTTVVTAEEETTEKPSVAEKNEPKELDGGRVFARYCGSCHAERYPREHSDAEWDVIVTHMQEPSDAKRLEGFDSGPDTIDVSQYPPEMKEKYELFAARCSTCHSLSRPINSDYALPDEWSRYVKRMMRKPGSGIKPKEGKQIYEFLAYDSSVRKKSLLEKKKAEQKEP